MTNGDPTPFSPDSENWDWNKILVTSDLGDTGSGCENDRGCLIHEMGHVMGLDEVFSGTAIMNYYLQINELGWQAPKADDVNGIQYLYP